MNKAFFGIWLLLFSVGLVSAAQGCSITVNAKTTAELLSEIPSINAQVQTCSPDLPKSASRLIKNGIFLIDVSDADDIALTINNAAVTGVSVGSTGKFSYKVTLTSCQLTKVLSSTDSVGSFISLYLNGGAKLVGGGFAGKAKLFFVRVFGKSSLSKAAVPVDSCPAVGSSNKPDNCFETFMQGHEQYQFAKEEWERKLAETGNVCQTQTSEMPKGGHCVYLFEQIKNNDKKWLCWYT